MLNTAVVHSVTPSSLHDDLTSAPGCSDSAAVLPVSSEAAIGCHFKDTSIEEEQSLDDFAHLAHIKKDDLSFKYIGGKNNTKLNGHNEKLPGSVVGASKGDTYIKSCSQEVSLINKPVADPNSKCLLFSHAWRYIGLGKFSTPGCKLKHEKKNTHSQLQNRSSTSDLGDGYGTAIKTYGVHSEKSQDQNIYSEETSKLKTDQSDLESYYTALTDCSSDVYQFSASSFVTCQEYFTSNQKSRLTKAKDFFIKGRNYVKTKLENYQQKLPGRLHKNKRFLGAKRCGDTCRFPCLFWGREVSQFSFGISECSATQEDNHICMCGEGKESKSNFHNDMRDEKSKKYHICGHNANTSDNLDLKKKNPMADSEGVEEYAAGLENGLDETTEKTDERRDKTFFSIMKLKEEMGGKSRTEEGPDSVFKAAREEEIQDELPIGTEAQTIMLDHITDRLENDPDQKPTNKRLRWLSTMDKAQSSSLHSSTTSNSSVEQFLFEREMDPEKLLKNLGFGFSADTDVSYGRIPDRFLLSGSSAGGIDLYKFILHHPDLHHLLWKLETRSEVQSTSGTSNQPGGKKQDSWGRQARQPTLSSLAHGVKFIQTARSEVNQPKPTEYTNSCVKDISELDSILDYPNRAFLAGQGFYGKEYVDKEKSNQEDKDEKSITAKPIDAAQRRKQFFQSSKSKNWSLTDEAGDDDDITVSESSSESFDRGLILRSFSEGPSISSESSLEGNDSFNEEDRRKSISNLRRQYQETIRKSIDGEFPDFFDVNNSEDRTQGIGDRHKTEVGRLMASLEDDGDYFAQSRQSSIKEVSLVKKCSQPSKDSTLTSPMSPKNFNFSFEKDSGGTQEFQSSNPARPVDNTNKQEISIIIEDETDSILADSEGIDAEAEAEKKIKADTFGLSPLALMQIRSDSSHTLVSQDSNLDTDSLSSDVTPQPGNISPGVLEQAAIFVDRKQISGEELSESASSSGTLSIIYMLDTEQEQRSRSPSQISITAMVEPEQNTVQLKPTYILPQESFELEEISSADTGTDDTGHAQIRRGKIEKSASTQSDSSGFADFESPQETHQYLNLPKVDENIFYSGRRFVVNKSHDGTRSSPPSIHQDDNKVPSDLEQTLTSSGQTLVDLKRNDENIPQNNLITHESNENVHVCSKTLSQKDNDLPSLTSILYTTRNNNSKNKSLVYTVGIPYRTDHSSSLSDLRSVSDLQRKYISSMKVDVAVKDQKDGKEKKNIFTTVGPVEYQEIDHDLEHAQLDPLGNTSNLVSIENKKSSIPGLLHFNDIQKNAEFTEMSAGKGQSQYHQSHVQVPHKHEHVLPGDRGMSAYIGNGLALKQKLRKGNKSKESLASAKRQMVDWLLSNQRQNIKIKSRFGATKIYSHPLSMSTPSLKAKWCSDRQLVNNQRSFERHSLDSEEILTSEISRKKYRKCARNSFDSQEILSGDTSCSQSRASLASSQELFPYKSALDSHQKHLSHNWRHEGSLLSEDEDFGEVKRSSLIDSSLGVLEDHLDYLKLARLISGPTNLMSWHGSTRSLLQYRPVVPIKHWNELHKIQHLEEETRLMQHAVQRYKTEMVVMETMLFNMCQLASSELGDEESADIEELQCLWSEVRKEIEKLEEHLSYRLSSILSGNNNFSLLNDMDVVQAMIDLLREQLYQQQLCISREISVVDADLETSVQSAVSPVQSKAMMKALSESALTDITEQMANIRESLTRTQLQQKQELGKSFFDLKEALVGEVCSEVNKNMKWLQDQLVLKEKEVQRLTMEMFLQNVKTGATRKRQYFESDV